MSAQRVREALSSQSGARTVLQRALPGEGAEMGTVEGAATLLGDDSREGETERPKLTLCINADYP
jgi:hypothetical protein